jgi:hypothetical protein
MPQSASKRKFEPLLPKVWMGRDAGIRRLPKSGRSCTPPSRSFQAEMIDRNSGAGFTAEFIAEQDAAKTDLHQLKGSGS